MFRSHFRMPAEGLIIEIRPQCGKCKKEFMLNLKNYLPGKYHTCTACGNKIQFDEALTQRVQKLTKEFEDAIQEAVEDVQKP
jgi:DNA-directed RNA polymerase subunit RPC12/RpoP